MKNFDVVIVGAGPAGLRVPRLPADFYKEGGLKGCFGLV